EAREKNRPLILDFGTESCIYCRKLDVTTLKDQRVITLMNQRFIPLKIDGNKEVTLTEQLQISSFPTVIVASPDGKILDRIDRYVEAQPFLDSLQKVVAAMTDPEWMNRDFELAGKAISSSDYARAIALLKSLVEDNGQRSVQVKARQLLQDLEQQ